MNRLNLEVIKMKKKVILSLVLVAVLIAAVVAVIAIKNKVTDHDNVQSFESIEEANENADFDLMHSDRLGGYPATGYESGSRIITVTFANAGYISKSLDAPAGSSAEYGESNDVDIDGITVTFKGDDGKVSLAEWNYNGYYYTVSLTESTDADTMTEYIMATR